VVALEENQLDLYTKNWPNLTYAILPAEERGIAYSRFIVKRMCTDAQVCWVRDEVGWCRLNRFNPC